MVKKHIVALVAILVLLVSVLPLQAMAASEPIAVNTSTSTKTIEKGGTGRLSLAIRPSERAEERCTVVFTNSAGSIVGEVTEYLENTTKNRGLAVTIDTAAMNLDVGTYNATFWIESKNQALNRWEIADEGSAPFEFKVVAKKCSSHKLEKVEEVEATCWSAGMAKYVCSVCKHEVCEEKQMIDHKFKLVDIIVAPTTTHVGEGRFECQTCPAGDRVTKIDIIPVDAIVKITAHPRSVTVAEGKKARFTIVASGMDLTYQWYSRASGATKGSKIAGATKEYCEVVAEDALHDYAYYCVVTDAIGNKATSEEATLRITGKLSITQQPAEEPWAYEGKKVTVSVRATGEGTLKYQWWYKDQGASDFVKDKKATASTYSVTMDETTNGRQVYCVVTDKKGTVQSNTVTLTMKYAAKILSHPVDFIGSEDDTAVFYVDAIGDGELSYQWYYRNKDTTSWKTSECIDDIYATTLKLERDGRQVYCKVTDEAGNEAKSNVATMWLLTAMITQQPHDVIASAGESVTFTVGAIGEELTYQWQYRNAGSSTWKNASSTDPTYTLEMKPERDGRQVRCVVKDRYDKKATSDVATMKLPEIVILKQPEDAKAFPGQYAEVSVVAYGDELEYKWYYKDKLMSEYAVSSLTGPVISVKMNEDRDGRRMYCVIKDQYGRREKTDTIKLSLASPLVITANPVSVVAAEDESVTFTVKAEGTGLEYQWYYKDAGSDEWKTASCAKATYTSTMKAELDGRLVRCQVTDAGGNMAYSHTAKMELKVPVSITTNPADVTVGLNEKAKFTVKAVGNGLTYKWYYRNEGATAWKTGSSTADAYELTMKLDRDKREVYCVVTDMFGKTAKSEVAKMLLKPAEPMAITSQPSDVTVALGETAKFTVQATGSGLTYQWYYRNAGTSTWKASSSTTATHTTTMKEDRDGRQFYCKITDAYGNTLESNIVKMILKAEEEPDTPDTPDTPDEPENTLKITSQPSNVTAEEGETVKFTVKATGDGLKYRWYYRDAGSSSWKASSNTKSTHTTTMKKDRDGRQFYCEITDAYGNEVKSNTVKMIMEAPQALVITSQPSSTSAAEGETVKFTVKANGKGLKYQWYYRNAGSSSWKKSSSTGATHTTTMKPDRDGRQFYCKITDAYGESVKTKTVTMIMVD